MERMKRAVCLLLCFVMVVGLLPMYAFAADADDALTAALAEAKAYIDALTVNNSSNDPSTVVSNFGTHFTWDNEKRESNSKVSYLYDWSYYNGVVFEGLEYLYEVTGTETYKDYVVEYMSSLITADGDWATCSNNSAKTAAGYNSTHGADCYKTASLLLDAYQMTGDERYLDMAEELYEDLDDAAGSYLLSNAGSNYRHTWASDPSPDLWLDGLYMILPFRAEYAKHIGDTEELDLIVSRMQWVSDNMYNSSKGLFYHAADSASSNSGTFWLRSIGWYAAAIVDVMDSMEGENLETMKAQLVKLMDGMYAATSEDVGYMWLNNMAAAQSSTNPYETSGTALTYYAVMKAVNNGWLDESYADEAVASFVYMCENKLEGNVLTDICFKGAPGSSNSTFYDNEGKGVGPFIMLYAEVLEYANSQEDETPAVDPVSYVMAEGHGAYAVGDDLTFTGLYAMTEGLDKIDLMDENGYPIEGVTINGSYDMNTVGTYSVTATYDGKTSSAYMFTVSESETLHEADNVTIYGCGMGIYDVTASVNTEAEGVAAKAIGADASITYSLSGTFKSTGFKATVVLTVPEEWRNGEVGVYHIDGEKYTRYEDVDNDPATYTFVTNHFSDWEQTYSATPTAEGDDATSTNSVSGSGYLVGGKTYTLAEDGITAGKEYLIVYTSGSTNYALTNNNNSSLTTTTVTVSGKTITVEDDGDIAWTIAGTSGAYISNNSYRLALGNNSASLTSGTSNASLNVSEQGDGAYRIYRTATSNWGGSSNYYLRYSTNNWSSGWTASTSTSGATLYLYEYTSSSSGEAVNFTVTPGSASIAPNGTVALTGTVTVAGETVDLSDCTITWASANTAYATVSNGTVTGVADGTANITATLTAVDGTAVADGGITVTIPVTVASKEIKGYELTGNSPIDVTLNEKPDFSNIKYEVIYEDDTRNTLNITFGECDTSTSGKKIVDIYYNNTKIGEVVVNVTVDFSKLEPATSYPEYPDDGAVRIDKTATHNAEEFNRTGVTHVELDVAGISVEAAVDVILIMDISNSMSWDDSEYDYNDTTVTSGTNQRLNIARDSAKEFINELMADNGDDDPETIDNTVTLLAFAGIDGDYNTHSTAASNDDVYQIGDLAMDTKDEANAALDELVKATTGGTNYDYAFQQAYALAQQLYNERGNRVYIVFMTDGVPTHYNGVYYKSRSNTDLTACMQYVDPTTGETSSYTSTGYDRNGNDIDATATKGITVYYNDGTTASKTVTYNKGWSEYVMNNKNGWAEKVKALDYVAHVYSIGFGMKNGSVVQGATTSMPTLSGVNGGQYYIPTDVTHATLSHIASDANSHFEADNKEELTKLYQSLASQIKFAGTEAVVKDTVGNNFSVQMLPYVLDKNGNQIALATPPSITIKTYDLNPRGTVDAEGNDITGKRTGTSDDIETVTFAVVNGQLEAYSSVIGAGVNILSTDADGNITISAQYFTYTKNAATSEEHFTWSIGNITDKEIALAFDAYLEGAMEGQRPEDIYYTNEEATLEYVDINGDYATQTFPVPGVAWGGATTTIRFYLVNEKGEPVNREGDVIPWENRIYVGDPVVIALNLNADLTIAAQKIEAAAHVPAEFFLYDANAYYTVQTTSSEDAITGGITVSDPSDDAFKTTGTAPNAVTQTGAQTTRVISHEDPYYTWSYVGFGVRWDLTKEPTEYVLTPDVVVIDYGKAIQVDVLANDVEREGYTRELVGFVAYNKDADLGIIQYNAGSATYTPDFGSYSIVGSKAQFQPTKMVDSIRRVFYAVRYTETANTENSYVVWGQLDIIPATIVYYETDFASGVFTTATTGADWSTVAEGNAADGPQDDGTVGQNTYGYDSSYTNDAKLSNGTSEFVLGQGYDAVKNEDGKSYTYTPKTCVTFSFTGTGFDLISRTGELQGLIKVEVFSDKAMTTAEKTVSVLNKSESGLELYQIPVVSINDLTYGVHYVRVSVDQSYTYTGTIDALKALNRGNQFYFDAIRVYNPAQGNTEAEAAYKADGEYNANIAEVRAQLLNAETYATITDMTTGMVFIDRTQTDIDEVGNKDQITHDYTVETYATIGPNNEVYLSKDQSVAFKIQTGSVPASVDIGAKSITNSNAGLMVSIVKTGTTTATWTVSKDIQSSTVQYFDLLNATNADKNLFSEGVYVVITNTSEGVLSITDIKVAFSDVSTVEALAVNDPSGPSVMSTAASDPYAVSYTVDANTLSVAKAVLIGSDNVEEPEVTEPEVEPNYDILSASVKSNGSLKNRKYTVTVVTSQDVVDIDVFQGDAELKASKISYKDNKKDGTRVWTIVLSSGVSERFDSFTLIGLGQDGTEGEAFVVSKSR